MYSDYYKRLGLTSSASENDIKKAFKKLARQYHPDKNQSATDGKIFIGIYEAYKILIELKANVQDKFKNGTSDKTYSNYNESYSDQSTDTSFESEPATNNKDTTYNQNSNFKQKTNYSSKYTQNKQDDKLRQDPPVVHLVFITLEEAFSGCTKRMRITRKYYDSDGRSVSNEEKMLVINIKPGWKVGTKVTFHQEGDRHIGTIPADIVFVIKDKPHPTFKRDGSDIIYTAQVKNALNEKIYVPNLFGNFEPVVIKNDSVRLIGLGLPLPKNPHLKGNLIVKFEMN